jgi:hypothetical protein
MRFVTALALELKALRVGRGNYKRLQERAKSSPRLAAAMASGRVESVDARGQKLTQAQRDRRTYRDGTVYRQPKQYAIGPDGGLYAVAQPNNTRAVDRAARLGLMEATRMKPKRRRK